MPNVQNVQQCQTQLILSQNISNLHESQFATNGCGNLAETSEQSYLSVYFTPIARLSDNNLDEMYKDST